MTKTITRRWSQQIGESSVTAEYWDQPQQRGRLRVLVERRRGESRYLCCATDAEQMDLFDRAAEFIQRHDQWSQWAKGEPDR